MRPIFLYHPDLIIRRCWRRTPIFGLVKTAHLENNSDKKVGEGKNAIICHIRAYWQMRLEATFKKGNELAL